jgi:hypothetical protein
MQHFRVIQAEPFVLSGRAIALRVWAINANDRWYKGSVYEGG